MKRVLLTGGTGFVGANLARRLLADGHDLHLFAPPGYDSWRVDSIRADLDAREIDLADADTVTRAVRDIRPDWIFHLAVYGAYSSQADARRMVTTNVVGTVNLVEACLETGFEAFVNTGSSSEYGFKDHAPHEQEWVDPNSYYAVTKASATLYCRYTAQKHNVLMPTLRLYSVYGPYEEPTRLMPTLILAGLRGELPPLVDPDIARDYIYMDDVCDAYLLAATVPGQEAGAVYNVGTGVQTTLREVVEAARRTLNITAEPQWGSMPNRQWDATVWVADNRRITAALGWQPRHTFEQGFRRMVEWLRGDPALLDFYAAHRETPK